MRMRTIEQAAIYLKEKDPQTAVTKHALQQMVKSGTLPSVQVGHKRLIALENLDTYFLGDVPNA